MRRSWWPYLSLTLASALIGHLIFDALDDGVIALVARPVHLVYLIVVFGAFGAAATDLRWPRRSERRRRIALMRATLRNSRMVVAVSLLAQVAIAGTTVLLEGPLVDGPHLVLSALCGFLALLGGTLMLRRVEAGILHLALADFIPRRPPASPMPKADTWLSIAISHELTYCLFRPNRPPPTFA